MRCALVTGVQTCALPIYGKRSRSGDHRHDIGFRLTIVGKNLRDHIDFVIETFWEQRADGPVDQAAGQRFLFSRAAFPLEKAARNASGGREFFLIMNGRSEEHTSEFPAQMRKPYTVLCLNNK